MPCLRFPLLRNGCAATVSAADVAFLASESNCGEVRWTRSSHADYCSPQIGKIVSHWRQRFIDISMHTQSQQADGDAERREGDVSRPDESTSKQEGEDMMTDEERKIWLAIRKEAGLKIDPETAEVDWTYAATLDPYGIDPELPEENRDVGRQYFARAPGSDMWVSFYDLPKATRDALWKKHS